ncbi:hypothetical protein PoB_006096000 [Plakobranchus ocellatus]|uniref:Uncharacterized protein n=1 Tax=Plakobranchus ocellatus TaxID=259542 RepID=A0AAV4CRB8_9GAST|nr:hypothetical protein PoB_006096000 [Plakobranchus ocellatus]
MARLRLEMMRSSRKQFKEAEQVLAGTGRVMGWSLRSLNMGRVLESTMRCRRNEIKGSSSELSYWPLGSRRQGSLKIRMFGVNRGIETSLVGELL